MAGKYFYKSLKIFYKIKLLIYHKYFQYLYVPYNFRKSKTAQESQKLHNVQNELQKIDQIVAGDVRLLRKTIEEASYAYMEAQ